MKSITKFAFMALSIFTLACSKDNDNPAPTAPDNTLILTKTERIVTSPIRNLTNSWWCAKLDSDDKFVFHNDETSPQPKGMMIYDIANNTFTDKAKCSEIGVGASKRLLNDGQGELYYISGTFNKYNESTNTWTSVNSGTTIFPTTILDGDVTSSITIPSKKRLYYVGGYSVKYFDITASAWNFAANYPIYTARNPAIATDNINKIYAMGGYVSDGGAGIKYKKLYSLDIQNNVWTELAEAPIDPARSSTLNTMVLFKNHLVYLGSDKKLYVYDIATNKWQNTSLDTDIFQVDFAHIELSTDGSKFYLIYMKANYSIGIQEYK